MTRVMISQPMNGKTKEEIKEARRKAVDYLNSLNYAILDTVFVGEWFTEESMKERGVMQIPLCFLAESLESMSMCNAVYFCKGWENARGCRIEHEAAKAYGLERIYEV